MKRRILGSKIALVLLPLFLLGGVPCRLFAQFIPSNALDPDCYFPQVGVPGEIDTIYGAFGDQGLGGDVMNIGPAPGGVYGRIAMQGYQQTEYTTPFDLFQGGPSFNLHNLQSLERTTIGFNNCQFVHLRSKRYTDAVYLEGYSQGSIIIYWEDDNGGYDSSRRTVLLRSKEDSGYTVVNLGPAILALSNDSTDDLLTFWYLGDHDSLIADAAWYKGSDLHGKDTAYADSLMYFHTVKFIARYMMTGDFRGTGRKDTIGQDESVNLFYYANDTPFSLTRFVRAMQYDTLMTYRQNTPLGIPFSNTALVMRAFPKPNGDRSVDLLTLLTDSQDTLHYSPQHVYFFRGGPNFGSKRLYLDSCDFLLHTPGEFGGPPIELGIMLPMVDCGDMTGTGNRVLMLQGEVDGQFYDYYIFYVTGNALDSKVDMYYEMDPSATASVDTLTADGDNLQDVILGMPSYFSYDDFEKYNKQGVGTVHILHGSKQIPVHLTSVAEKTPIDSGQLEVYPNPATTHCSVIIRGNTGEAVSIVLRDLLGREVSQSAHRSTGVGGVYTIMTGNLPSGVYELEANSGGHIMRSQLAIVR